MTTDTGTAVEATSAPVGADTVPSTGIEPAEPPSGSAGHTGGREARYRTERNQARDELAAAQLRIDVLLAREAERVASSHLADPADLFALTDKTIADFVGEDGELDHDLITEIAADILANRPGLAKGAITAAMDPSQGLGRQSGRREPSFTALFS